MCSETLCDVENISCYKSYQQNTKKEKTRKTRTALIFFAICTSSGLIGMQNNVVSHYLGHKNSTWEFLNFSTCHWFGSERSTFGPNPDVLGWEAHPKNGRHWANIQQIKNLTICLSSLLRHWNQKKNFKIREKLRVWRIWISSKTARDHGAFAAAALCEIQSGWRPKLRILPGFFRDPKSR